MDIIKRFEVSQYPAGEEAVELLLCFDNGSPYTFIKRSSALGVGRLFELVEPESFSGLGGGNFQSRESILLHVKLLQFWCRHWTFVVEDNILEEDYDILAGHDFMQRYGIKLLPHEGDIEIDEVRLRLAQRIRKTATKKGGFHKLKRGLTLSLITFLLLALLVTAFPPGLSSQAEAPPGLGKV